MKTAIVLLDDLMFQVKIEEALKRGGYQPRFVKTAPEVLQAAISRPTLVVIDLNYAAAGPMELISALRRGESTSDLRLLGYVSHVQTDIRKSALELGCQQVVPRSALMQTLQKLAG